MRSCLGSKTCDGWMFVTTLCLGEEVEVGYYSDERFESTVNRDVTPQKLDAFDYVMSGMFARDA
jgi:hypothetical protein